jgi:two-component system alkaline phosphatase synthesis response regulator PhoP
MKGRILIVEDDSAIAMALQDRLQNEGYGVECVGDGIEGFDRSINSAWNLIILDIMLPGKDGLEVCRDIRAKGVDTPILMLTARDETVDKVVGLKMGADDYLTKPFEMIELRARVEALLRRRVGTARTSDAYKIGAFEFDLRRRELRRDRRSIPLTTYEFKLLRYLCEHRGEIFDRDVLLNTVWGYDAVPYTRTIDIHIASLRKKLGDSKKQELIITVRGQGYKLVE